MSLTRPHRFTKSVSLTSALALAAVLGACSNDPAHPGSAGAAGNGGNGGSTGGAGNGAAGTTGTAGTTGSAGNGGSAGTTGAAGGGAAGTTGTAGTTGAAGTSGAAGTTGAGGSSSDGGTTDGGTTSYKPFVCPPGPFAAQTRGTAKTICNSGGFKYRYDYVEGPTWIASQNAFFFSNFIQGNKGPNPMAGDIIKATLAADGSATCEQWVMDVGCNGLGVGANGKLIGACHGPRAVMEFDLVTKQSHVVAGMANGKMFDSPNDLIAHSSGNIYFSNTTYELGNRTAGGIGSALVRIDPLGVATVIQTGGINGVALSPDEKLLYVVTMGVWNVNTDGSLGTKTNMGGPNGDGLAVDCAGHVTADPTNSAYGGPDGKTLIVVSGNNGNISAKLIPVTIPGLP